MATQNTGGMPIAQVAAMKQQGYTNDQIIQALQKDGYSSSVIFDTINLVELRSGVDTPGVARTNVLPPQQPVQQQPKPQVQQMQSSMNYDATTVATDEYVESVIDEKWRDFEKDIQKIIDWKNGTEKKLTTLTQQFGDLKDDFNKLRDAVVGKIGEYDKNILDVGAEIKAMEKVFMKVLPAFTENVAQLSKVTESLKETSSTKTQGTKSSSVPKK